MEAKTPLFGRAARQATLRRRRRPRERLPWHWSEQISAMRGRMAPAVLTLGCMALIALFALMYLGQVASVTAANQHLQTLQAEQAQLLRQDQQLHARLGRDQSPAYIRSEAQAQGLVPATPGSQVVIQVPGLGARTSQSQPGQAGGQP